MTDLHLTHHVKQRMQQRGLRVEDLDLLLLLGVETTEGFIVNRKDYQALERSLIGILDRAKRLVGKRVVVREGAAVTSYHATGRQQRNLRRSTKDWGLD